MQLKETLPLSHAQLAYRLLMGTKKISTEEKIIVAASKVFLKKGFSSARTRDISEEADINIALLNYYFRSKQKLFDLVMYEKVQKLFGKISPIMRDNTTSLGKKIQLATTEYIDTLSETPGLAIFILNEVYKNNYDIVPNMKLARKATKSSLFKQVKEIRKDMDPFQLVVTLAGMIIFPFVAKPMLKLTANLSEKTFQKLMQERKVLIPIWMKAILKSKS